VVPLTCRLHLHVLSKEHKPKRINTWRATLCASFPVQSSLPITSTVGNARGQTDATGMHTAFMLKSLVLTLSLPRCTLTRSLFISFPPSVSWSLARSL